MRHRNFPPPVVEEHRGFRIVRDDLIDGGTKSRCMDAIFDEELARDYQGRTPPPFPRVVYASPVYGYAQVAIAIAAKWRGWHSVIFVAKRNKMHFRTRQARRAGAEIREVPFGYLSNIQSKARNYATLTDSILLPWGLDTPALVLGMTAAALWINPIPTEVWCVAGSGSLTRALQVAWPKAVHHAVRVGSTTSNIGRAIEHVAPEKFEHDAKTAPPFPSVSNYDAKAWQFMVRHASPGALFWNVAG